MKRPRARQSSNEKSYRPQIETCLLCPNTTSDRKPYCIDHVFHLPHAKRVTEKCAGLEAEALRIVEEGWKKVDLSCATVYLVAAALAQRTRSAIFREIANDAGVNFRVAEVIANALCAKKFMKVLTAVVVYPSKKEEKYRKSRIIRRVEMTPAGRRWFGGLSPK